MLFPRQLGAAYLLLIGCLCHQSLQIPDHRLLVQGGHLVQEIVPFYWHQDGLTLGVVRTGSLLFLGHDGSLLVVFFSTFLFVFHQSFCLTDFWRAVRAYSSDDNFRCGSIFFGSTKLYGTTHKVRAINDKSRSISHDGCHVAPLRNFSQVYTNQHSHKKQVKHVVIAKYENRKSHIDNGTIVP